MLRCTSHPVNPIRETFSWERPRALSLRAFAIDFAHCHLGGYRIGGHFFPFEFHSFHGMERTPSVWEGGSYAQSVFDVGCRGRMGDVV